MKVAIFYLTIIGILISCKTDNCNYYTVSFDINDSSKLNENSLVFMNRGIIGKVKSISKEGRKTIAVICVNRDIEIPVQSKWELGYVKRFAIYAIHISFSNKSEYISRTEIQKGILLDSIEMKSSYVDSAMKKKVLKVMKDLSKGDSIMKN